MHRILNRALLPHFNKQLFAHHSIVHRCNRNPHEGAAPPMSLIRNNMYHGPRHTDTQISLHTLLVKYYNDLLYTLALSVPIVKKKSLQRFLEKTTLGCTINIVIFLKFGCFVYFWPLSIIVWTAQLIVWQIGILSNKHV